MERDISKWRTRSRRQNYFNFSWTLSFVGSGFGIYFFIYSLLWLWTCIYLSFTFLRVKSCSLVVVAYKNKVWESFLVLFYFVTIKTSVFNLNNQQIKTLLKLKLKKTRKDLSDEISRRFVVVCKWSIIIKWYENICNVIYKLWDDHENIKFLKWNLNEIEKIMCRSAHISCTNMCDLQIPKKLNKMWRKLNLIEANSWKDVKSADER